MTRKAALFAGLLLSGMLAAAAGCGGEDTNTTGSGGAGGDGSTTNSSASSTTTSSASSSANSSASSSSGGGALTCESYCMTIMAGCTADNAQYPSNDSCLGSCAAFPPGMSGDTSGNTLGCHLYHAEAADDSAMNATTHCHHAGPGGGDGTCGGGCEGFCAIAVTVCTGADEQWAIAAECETDCMANFAPDPANTYDVTNDAMGDTFSCRLYHLTNAAIDAASATTHCPHIIAMSPVCN